VAEFLQLEHGGIGRWHPKTLSDMPPILLAWSTQNFGPNPFLSGI
jgi:hypothetical protein